MEIFSLQVLLRLYHMNSIMFQVCHREDAPLKLKGNRYAICEDKMRSIAELAKAEVSSHHSHVAIKKNWVKASEIQQDVLCYVNSYDG